MYPPTPFVGVKKVDSYLARLQRQNTTALASPFPPPQPQSLPLPLLLPFPRLELHLGPNPYPTPAPNQPPATPPFQAQAQKATNSVNFQQRQAGGGTRSGSAAPPTAPKLPPTSAHGATRSAKKHQFCYFSNTPSGGRHAFWLGPFFSMGPEAPPPLPPTPPPKPSFMGRSAKNTNSVIFQPRPPAPAPAPQPSPYLGGRRERRQPLNRAAQRAPSVGAALGRQSLAKP